MPAPILVTSLHDSGHGTLRAAIERANVGASNWGGQTHTNIIKFAPSLKGTILLTSALPDLGAHIVITSPIPIVIAGGITSGVAVARSDAPGTPAFRIFTVAKHAVVTISNVSITGGSAPDGGAIDNAGSLSLANTQFNENTAVGPGSGSSLGALGGAIDNTGTLSVLNTTFAFNSATGSTNGTGGPGDGGAIANSDRLSINNCMFVSNSATGGGGHYAGSGGGAQSRTPAASQSSEEPGSSAIRPWAVPAIPAAAATAMGA